MFSAYEIHKKWIGELHFLMASQPHTRTQLIMKRNTDVSGLWWRPFKIHSAAIKHTSFFSAAQSHMSYDHKIFLQWFVFRCFQISLPVFLGDSGQVLSRFLASGRPESRAREVNNFPSLLFSASVLVLSCCLLFCCSGASRGDLICALLLNPRSQNNIVFIWPK